MGLFGWQLARDKKSVVITSSEVDAMAIHQKTGQAAISLPKGHSSLPQEVGFASPAHLYHPYNSRHNFGLVTVFAVLGIILKDSNLVRE